MSRAPSWCFGLILASKICLAAQFSCHAVSNVEACLPTWCECASQITTLPLPPTVTPSLAGAGVTLLTIAVSSSTFQYSLGYDRSCNFATIPNQAICVDNKNVVPICPTPADILVNGACTAASGEASPQATDYSSRPFGSLNGTTMASSSSTFKAASTTGVVLASNSSGSSMVSSTPMFMGASRTVGMPASSTLNVSPTISSAAVQSTPYVNPNPYGCSQVIPQDLNPAATITTMVCVCQGTTLPLQSTVISGITVPQCAYTSSPFLTITSTQAKTSLRTSSPIVAATGSSLVVFSGASSSEPYAIPTGLPSGNYSLASCSNPILPDPDSPDYMTKCLYSNCQEVKANVITYWQDYQEAGHTGTFLDQFAYYLKPTNGMYCDAEYSLLGCTDAGVCTSYNWPGGWLLMREVIQFTQFYRTIYQGFANNFATTLGLCEEYGKVFSPVDDTSTLWQKVLIAIAGLFGGQILAAILRKILVSTITALAEANAEYVTQLKTFTTNIASGGATIGINLDTSPTQTDITGDLQAFLTIYFEYTKAAIEFYISDIFKGSNMTQFEETFGTGVWAWPEILPALNDTTFDSEVSTVYFGIHAVPAWTLRQLNPVLMYDDKDPDCSAKDPFHDTASNYKGALNTIFGTGDSSTQAYVCYDNKRFWLASWGGEWKETFTLTTNSEAPTGWKFAPKLSGLTGIDTLNGTAWGTLSVLDLVTSAWEGYKSNNYVNGYATNPLFDGSLQSGNVSLEFGNGIQSPGLVQMTLCPLSSLIRGSTLLVGNIPNLTAFATSPCPSDAFFDCTVLPCDGVSN